MHSSEREKTILAMLKERGFLTFKDLDRALQASPATLRRDLERLEGEGRLQRLHGGARAVRAGTDPPLTGVPFHENMTRNARAKEAIGRSAAALCRPGEAVIIDGGSTTLAMCPFIANLNLQVLTNSLHIVLALLPSASTRVAVPAGGIFREQNLIISPYEEDGMDSYRASKLFIGAAAVGPDGPMQADVLLIQAERRLLKRAAEIILLVDSSKFEGPNGHLLCPLSEIDIVITDAGAGEAHHRMIERAGPRLIIAG